jgi:hypothetical protein
MRIDCLPARDAFDKFSVPTDASFKRPQSSVLQCIEQEYLPPMNHPGSHRPTGCPSPEAFVLAAALAPCWITIWPVRASGCDAGCGSGGVPFDPPAATDRLTRDDASPAPGRPDAPG